MISIFRVKIFLSIWIFWFLQNLENFQKIFKWCSRHMLTRLDIFVLGLTRLGTLELSDSRLINSTIFKIFWWCLSFAAFIFINSLFKKNIISSTFLNHIIRKHGFYGTVINIKHYPRTCPSGDPVSRPQAVREMPSYESCSKSLVSHVLTPLITQCFICYYDFFIFFSHF